MEHFAWPAVVVILAVFFLIWFRKDISALLGRTQKISKNGIQTFGPRSQEFPEKRSSAEELMRAFDSVTLLEKEKIIKTDLESKGLSDQKEAIDVLIRHLAATQIALGFEYINKLIWGSQLEILVHLNATPQGDPTNMLKPFYENAAVAYPTAFASYTFEQYSNFLISAKLITFKDGRYFITNFGRDFLAYLVNTGQTSVRPL